MPPKNPNGWQFFPGNNSGRKPIYQPPRQGNSESDSQAENALRQMRHSEDYESMRAQAVQNKGLDYDPVWGDQQAYNNVINRYQDLRPRYEKALNEGLLEHRDIPRIFRNRDMTPEQGQSARRVLEARLNQVESNPDWARQQISNRNAREEALAGYYDQVANPFLQKNSSFSAREPFLRNPDTGDWLRDERGHLTPSGDSVLGEATIRMTNVRENWSVNLNVLPPAFDPFGTQSGTLFVNGQAMRPAFPGIKGASPTSTETQQKLFGALFSSGRNPNAMIRDEKERNAKSDEYSPAWHSLITMGEGGPGALGKLRNDWHLPDSYMLVNYDTPEIPLMKGGKYKNPLHQSIADELKDGERRLVKNREEFLTEFGLTARKGVTSTVTSLQAFASGSGKSMEKDASGNMIIYGIGEEDRQKAFKRNRTEGMYEMGFGQMTDTGFVPDSRRMSSMFVTGNGDLINSYRMRELRFLGSAGGYFGEGEAVFNTGAERNQNVGVGGTRYWDFDLPTDELGRNLWSPENDEEMRAQLARQLPSGQVKVGDQSFDLGKNWENAWIKDFEVKGNKLYLSGEQAGAAMSNKHYMKEFLKAGDLSQDFQIDGQDMREFDIAGPISGDILSTMYGTLDAMTRDEVDPRTRELVRPGELNTFLSQHMDSLRQAAAADETNRDAILQEVESYQQNFFKNGVVNDRLPYNSTTLPLLAKAFTKSYLPQHMVNVGVSQTVHKDSLDNYLSDRSAEQKKILDTWFGGDADAHKSWLGNFDIQPVEGQPDMYNVKSVQPAFDLNMGANFRAEMSSEDAKMNGMIRRQRYMYGDPNEKGALDVIGADIARQAGGLVSATMANKKLSSKSGIVLDELTQDQKNLYGTTSKAALAAYGDNPTQAQLVQARMAGLHAVFGSSMVETTLGGPMLASPEAMSRYSAYNDTGEQVGMLQRYTDVLDKRFEQLFSGDIRGIGEGKDLEDLVAAQTREAEQASTRSAALGGGRTDSVNYKYLLNSKALAANEMVMNVDQTAGLIKAGLIDQGVDPAEAHEMAHEMALKGAVMGATRNPSLDVAQATTNMATVTPDQLARRGGLSGSLFGNQAVVNPLWSAHQRSDVDADAAVMFWAGTVQKDASGAIMRDATGKIMTKQASATSSQRIIDEALNAPGGEYMNQMQAAIAPKKGGTHQEFINNLMDAMVDPRTGKLKGISGQEMSQAASASLDAAGNMGEFYNWGRGFEAMRDEMGLSPDQADAFGRTMSRMSSEVYQEALDLKRASPGAQLLQRLQHGSVVTGFDTRGQPMWAGASTGSAGNLHKFGAEIFAGFVAGSEFSPEEAAFALTPGGGDSSALSQQIAEARAGIDNPDDLMNYARGLHNAAYNAQGNDYFLGTNAPGTLMAGPGALKSMRKGQEFRNPGKNGNLNAAATPIYEKLARAGGRMNAAIRMESKGEVTAEEMALDTRMLGPNGSQQYLNFLDATESPTHPISARDYAANNASAPVDVDQLLQAKTTTSSTNQPVGLSSEDQALVDIATKEANSIPGKWNQIKGLGAGGVRAKMAEHIQNTRGLSSQEAFDFVYNHPLGKALREADRKVSPDGRWDDPRNTGENYRDAALGAIKGFTGSHQQAPVSQKSGQSWTPEDEADVNAQLAASGGIWMPGSTAPGAPGGGSSGGSSGGSGGTANPGAPFSGGGPYDVNIVTAPRQLDTQDAWNMANWHGDIFAEDPAALLAAGRMPGPLSRDQGNKLMNLFKNVRQYGDIYSQAKHAEAGVEGFKANNFSGAIYGSLGPTGANFENSPMGQLYDQMSSGNNTDFNALLERAGDAAGMPKTAAGQAYSYRNRQGFGTRDDDTAAGMAGALGDSLNDLQKIMLKLTDSTRSLTKEEAAQVDTHGKLFDALSDRIEKAKEVVASDQIEDVDKAPAQAFLGRLQGMSFKLNGQNINGLEAIEQVGGALQGPEGLTERAVNQRRQGEYEFSDRDQSPFVRLLKAFTSHGGDAGERLASVYGSESWREMSGAGKAAVGLGAAAIGGGTMFMNNWWMMRHIASGLVNPVMQASDQYSEMLRAQAGNLGVAGFGSGEITDSQSFMGANSLRGARLRADTAFARASYETWSPVQQALATPNVANARAIGEPAVGAALGASWFGSQLAQKGLMSPGAAAMLGPAAFGGAIAVGVASNMAEFGTDIQRQTALAVGGPSSDWLGGATYTMRTGAALLSHALNGGPGNQYWNDYTAQQRTVQAGTSAANDVMAGREVQLTSETMNPALAAMWKNRDESYFTGLGVDQNSYMQAGATALALNGGRSTGSTTDIQYNLLRNQAAGVGINDQMQLGQYMATINTGVGPFGIGDKSLLPAVADATLMFGDNQNAGRMGLQMGRQYADISSSLARAGQRSPLDFVRDMNFLSSGNGSPVERLQYQQNMEYSQTRANLASTYQMFSGNEGQVSPEGRANNGAYTGDAYSQYVRNLPGGLEKTIMTRRAPQAGQLSAFYRAMGMSSDAANAGSLQQMRAGQWQPDEARASSAMLLQQFGISDTNTTTAATNAGMLGVDWQDMVSDQMIGQNVAVGSDQERQIIERTLGQFGPGQTVNLPQVRRDNMRNKYGNRLEQMSRQAGYVSPGVWEGSAEQYEGQLRNANSVMRTGADYGLGVYGAGFDAADDALRRSNEYGMTGKANRIMAFQEHTANLMDQWSVYGNASQANYNALQGIAATGDATLMNQTKARLAGDRLSLSQMSGSNMTNANAYLYTMQTGQFGGTFGREAGYDENMRAAGMAPRRAAISALNQNMGGMYLRSGEAGMDLLGMNTVEMQGEIKSTELGLRDLQFAQERRQMARRRTTTTGVGMGVVRNQVIAAGGAAFAGAFQEGQGEWYMEDQGINLQRAQQDYSYQQQGRQLDLSQRRFTQAGTQFMENYALKQQQSTTQIAWQQQDMAINRQQTKVQQGWQMEDLAFQRNMSEVQFGQSMVDADENIRYARGRERRTAMRHRDDATVVHSMQMGQMDKEEDRAKERIKWEDERFQREKSRFDQSRQWTQQQLALELRHFQEDRRLEQESMNLQVENYQRERQFILEQRALEDQQRAFRRGIFLVEQQESEVMMTATQEAKKKVDALGDAINLMATYAQNASAMINASVQSGSQSFVRQVTQFSSPSPEGSYAGTGGAVVTSGLQSSPVDGATVIASSNAAGAYGGSSSASRGRSFATGGHTGDGPSYQEAGVVHNREYVIPEHGAPVVYSPEQIALLREIAEIMKRIEANGGNAIFMVDHRNPGKTKGQYSNLFEQTWSK